MATYTNSLVNLPASGVLTKMSAADVISLTNITVTGAAVFTGATVTGITVQNIGDGTGSMGFNGSGALTVTGTTSIDIDCSAALSINSTGGVIAIGNDANNNNISLGTGGTRTISVGSATATLNMNLSGAKGTWTIRPTTNSALEITDGTNTFLDFNSSSALLVHGTTVTSYEGSDSDTLPITVLGTAGATIAVGDVVTYNATTGKIVQADANGAGNLKNPAGTCRLGASDTQPTALAYAGLVPVTFASAPASSSIGALVYLSETAGRGTLTAPSTIGSRVYKLGILVSADGAATTCRVLWQPQFIADL